MPLRACLTRAGWISGITGAVSTTTTLLLTCYEVWEAGGAAKAVSVVDYVADVRVRTGCVVSVGELFHSSKLMCHINFIIAHSVIAPLCWVHGVESAKLMA